MLELKIIPDVEEVLRKMGSTPIHPVRALSVNDRCETLEYIEDLRKNHPQERKTLIRNLALVAQSQRVFDEKKVKKGIGVEGVYEVRVHRGHSRLFFVYVPTSRGLEIVLLTLGYFKSDDSKAKQDQGFKKSGDQIQTHMEEIIDLLEAEFSDKGAR